MPLHIHALMQAAQDFDPVTSVMEKKMLTSRIFSVMASAINQSPYRIP